MESTSSPGSGSYPSNSPSSGYHNPNSSISMMSTSNNSNGNFQEIEDAEFSSIYHKIASLSTEIERNILDLHTPSTQYEVTRSFQWMKNESFKDLTPEVDYLTRLYRYYVDEVQSNKLRASNLLIQGHDEQSMSLIDQIIPSYIYDGIAEQIVGYQAFKTNVFWSRLSTGLFSFLSFVIMSCVPFISHKRVSPHMLFNNDCPYKNDAEYKVGSFDFLSYQYIIGLGVVSFVYSILFAVFYVLPVDENSRKYIPGPIILILFLTNFLDAGLRSLCEKFLSNADINAYHHIVSDTVKQTSKSVEPIIDGGLFFMVLIAGIRAAVAVEAPQEFGSDVVPYHYYYSLNTFTATFENTDPLCVEGGTVELIRAATAMTFLSALSIGFTFQISLRSYLKEQQKRETNQGEGGSSHHQVPMMKSPLDQEDSVRL